MKYFQLYLYGLLQLPLHVLQATHVLPAHVGHLHEPNRTHSVSGGGSCIRQQEQRLTKYATYNNDIQQGRLPIGYAAAASCASVSLQEVLSTLYNQPFAGTLRLIGRGEIKARGCQ